MSLHGLDKPAITEAHRAALEDPAGWFLLHYTSRDEVDLWRTGSGGYMNVKEAISEYTNKSPIYGLFRFRRRTIVLKYIPEGTSRLLQARTSVHFPSVTDTFSPHDAVLSATDPDDLSDSALSSLCSLHTASGTSSVSSTRPNGLEEINEAKEEPPQSARLEKEHDKSQIATPSAGPVASPVNGQPRSSTEYQQVRTSEDDPSPRAKKRYGKNWSNVGQNVPIKTDRGIAAYPDPLQRFRGGGGDVVGLKQFLDNGPPASFLPVRPGTQATTSSLSQSQEDGSAPDASLGASNDVRPSTAHSDVWKTGFDFLKPKVKLFPRPVANDRAAQSQNSSGFRQRLPTGLRTKSSKRAAELAQGKTPTEDRPKSSKSRRKASATVEPLSTSSSRSTVKAFKPSEDIPPFPVPPQVRSISQQEQRFSPAASPSPTPLSSTTEPRPSHSRATDYSDSRSQSSPTMRMNDNSSRLVNGVSDDTVVSPEKERLIRAMQMRRRQYKLSEDGRIVPTDNEGPDNARLNDDALGKSDSAVEIDLSRTNDSRDNGAEALPSSRGALSSPPLEDATSRRKRRPNLALQSHPVNAEEFRSAGLSSAGPATNKSDFSAREQDFQGLHSHPVSPEEYQSVGSPLDMKKISPPDVPVKRKPVPNGPTTPATDMPRERSEALSASRAEQPHLPYHTTQEASIQSPANTQSSRSQQNRVDQQKERARLEHARGLSTSPVSMSRMEVLDRHTRQASAAAGSNGSAAVSSPQDRIATPDHRATPSPSHNRTATATPEIPKETNYTENQARTNQVAVPKKFNASSGISRRLQALAGRSRDENGSNLATKPSRPFLTSEALQRSQTDRPNTPNSSVRQGLSRATSFDSQQSQSVTDSRRRDPVSYTTHIPRTPNVGRLNRPSAIIEEEVDGYGGPGKETLRPLQKWTSHTRPFARAEHAPSVASSRPESRGSTVTNLTRGSLDGWRSFWRTDSKPRPGTSRSNLSVDQMTGMNESEPRGGRLMKRMSILVRKPNGQAENTEDAERGLPVPSKSSSEAGRAVAVGDLNVQFPDSLLWKRRWVEIDNTGNLVTTASRAQERSLGPGKRYHLTEFRPPWIASRDQQEFPFTIVLELVSGGTLQLGCGDAMAQKAVFRRLTDSHQHWLYQM